MAVSKEEAERLTKALVDKGMLIEAGWIGLKMASMPEDAPEIQVTEMRQAFFAGAHHVFTSILSFVSPGGGEPTNKDLQRMAMVESELDEFLRQFKLKYGID